MKMNFGKRILMFLHWLFSLLICAAFVVHLFWPAITNEIYQMLVQLAGATPAFFIGIAILALYALLCIVQIAMICKRSKKNRADRGFITVDSSDTSRVRIAISAIEQMVRQSVHSIDGITDMKISIENSDDAIAINIVASILNGSHVPTITMNMQQAIRKFVELNCGVAVRAVSVNINSVTSPEDNTRKKRREKNAAPVVEQPAVPFAPVASAPVAEPVNAVPVVEEPVVSETAVAAEEFEAEAVEAVCEADAAADEISSEAVSAEIVEPEEER